MKRLGTPTLIVAPVSSSTVRLHGIINMQSLSIFDQSTFHWCISVLFFIQRYWHFSFFCFVSSSCSCDGKSCFFLHSLKAWPEGDTMEFIYMFFWYFLVCDLRSKDYWLTYCSSQANTSQDLAVTSQLQHRCKLFSRHWAFCFQGCTLFNSKFFF